jgi:integrase
MKGQGHTDFIGVSQQIAIEEIKLRLQQRYESKGWSMDLWKYDMSILNRLGKHPQDVTLDDCERFVLIPTKTNSRSNYELRLKSLFRSMNELGLIDNNPTLKLATIRRVRNQPRPLTDHEVSLLLNYNDPASLNIQNVRDFVTLGCFAGMRAMEVSGIRGSDLELTQDGYMLRIRGKGNTDLSIPAHPAVVELINRHNTLGRLWWDQSATISQKVSKAMRYVGINNKSFHACRHYFATTALKASGGDLLVVRDLMRHTSVATTQRYTALEQSRPTAVVNMLAIPTTKVA